MGRILETLRKPGPRCTPPELKVSPAPSEADPATPAESAEEVPYIEVGGPRTVLDASPRVLAAAGRQPSVSRLTAPVDGPRLLDPAGASYQGTAVAPPILAPAARRFAPQILAYHQPDHPVSEQYRSLLTHLTTPTSAGRSQVLLLASAAAATGTTTVALNLAVTRAKQGSQVVVVDANLREPAVAARLGLPEAPGLRDVAATSVPLSRALQETGLDGFWALAAGEANSPATEWPPGEALRAVLRQLRDQFDWILVDSPSWDGGPEMVSIASACDAVYLVLRPGEVAAPPVSQLGRLIPHLGSRLGGYILTQR